MSLEFSSQMTGIRGGAAAAALSLSIYASKVAEFFPLALRAWRKSQLLAWGFPNLRWASYWNSFNFDPPVCM